MTLRHLTPQPPLATSRTRELNVSVLLPSPGQRFPTFCSHGHGCELQLLCVVSFPPPAPAALPFPPRCFAGPPATRLSLASPLLSLRGGSSISWNPPNLGSRRRQLLPCQQRENVQRTVAPEQSVQTRNLPEATVQPRFSRPTLPQAIRPAAVAQLPRPLGPFQGCQIFAPRPVSGAKLSRNSLEAPGSSSVSWEAEGKPYCPVLDTSLATWRKPASPP
mmetsp:Transcript_9096/g.18613  ORF Transcript_9096/g.18613 Transcript_9096/m.18613 type:complete len:219 (+) Transcript_9096:1309-1965(+)